MKKAFPIHLKVLSAMLLSVVVAGGVHWGQKAMMRQEVFNALRDNDRMRRLETLRRMAVTNRDSTTSALLDALEGTDKQLRSRAAWALSLLPLKQSPEVANALVYHLKTDPDTAIRLSCAIGLMGNQTPQAVGAYIHAAKDTNEKVAMVACSELGYRGAEGAAAGAVEVLFELLAAPSWHIRLQACKALINLKAADGCVVMALEKMSQEPEAKEYDADIESFERIDKEVQAEFPDESEIEVEKGWGKIETLLQHARDIAAQS